MRNLHWLVLTPLLNLTVLNYFDICILYYYVLAIIDDVQLRLRYNDNVLFCHHNDKVPIVASIDCESYNVNI